MADPICRWRNPYVPTVLELIDLLPKSELLQEQARELVIARSPYDFFRTPYQLACQLGLYHETNGRYFPKFTISPSENEINSYLENWIIHYCIPNPYTRGFEGLQPFSIHAEICRRLNDARNSLAWETVKTAIFGNEIGNNDILINSINSYSPIIEIRNGRVQLKAGSNYEALEQYVNVDISADRNNKEYFFDLFPVAGQNGIPLEGQEVPSDIDEQESTLITQVQGLIDLTQTEKNQIVAARIGQGFFRRNLILNCGFCPVTLVDDSRLLIASHIKPWKVSSNAERLNVNNGFLFTPTVDKLFDAGYISFTDQRRLLISPLISANTQQKLNLVNDTLYERLPVTGRELFLNYHRENVFKS